MNNVVLIGRLARDPELRYTGTGKAVTTLTVAVNRGFGKDNDADFIPVVVWEKQAENCANYLTKGSQVGVQGRIQVRSYEAQNGEKRYVTEVVGNQVEFLSSSGKSGGDDYSAPVQHLNANPSRTTMTAALTPTTLTWQSLKPWKTTKTCHFKPHCTI